MEDDDRPRIPFWIIVCIAVPLGYVLLINPLFFGFLGDIGDVREEKRETRWLLKERYDQSFKILSFHKPTMLREYEGRVLSKGDNIVFNVRTGSGGSENDYRLRAWAHPIIAPKVSDDTVYEVDFAGSLSAQDEDQDYRDTIFIKNPRDLSIHIKLAYPHKIKRSQLYSIVESFKHKEVGEVQLVLHPMLAAPDIKKMQKQDMSDYIEEHGDQFVEECVIGNYGSIDAEEDIIAASACMDTD
ncbi:hypothetical protein [Paenibacillus tengchongensis]|uniref:hypothetical protein n=1 Tax=Paenibacillus tengchongensis TaxID=2608684 RepID=UPI00124D8284|nr:hypothetical protein [Paenibacillus tengchongensis]